MVDKRKRIEALRGMVLATTTEVMGGEDSGTGLGRKDNRDKDVNKMEAGERSLRAKIDSTTAEGMATRSMVVTAKVESEGKQDGRENRECGKNKRCFI
jgi:hypothetical protein